MREPLKDYARALATSKIAHRLHQRSFVGVTPSPSSPARRPGSDPCCWARHGSARSIRSQREMEPIEPPSAVGGQRHGREPFVLNSSRGVPRHVVDPPYGPVLVGEIHIDRAALVPTGSRVP